MIPGLVISLAAGVFVLLGTVLIGVPVAVRLSRPHIWRRGPMAELTRAPPLNFAPSFEPLDLGPDPVRWPSETPWPDTALKELPWPSQTWDDPHFGTHWRSHPDGQAADRAYEAAQDARRAASALQRQVDDEGRVRREATKVTHQSEIQQRARDEVQRMQERARAAQDQARQQVGRQAQEVRQRGKQAARQAAEAAAQSARQSAEQRVRKAAPVVGAAMDNLPSNAELEALVTQVGLAGTVQEIMKRTGWDFKTAAQYLARARRGR